MDVPYRYVCSWKEEGRDERESLHGAAVSAGRDGDFRVQAVVDLGGDAVQLLAKFSAQFTCS